MTNIWIISQLFYPEETSTANIMTKIAETLSEKNIVNVICSTSNYQSQSLKTNKLLKSNINVIRINTPPLNKNNIFFRILLFLHFTFSVFLRILFKIKKNDTVILVTNPPTILFATAILKPIKSYKLIVILQDIFPENASISGIINKSSFIYEIVLRAMNYGYSKADKLIACGKDMAQHFINKGIELSIINVIQNWADEELFTTKHLVDRNEYFGLNLTNKIVIEFAGNIGRVQGLDKFLKIFSKSKNLNLVLLIIGNGAFKNKLENFVKDNNLKNVYFLNSKTRNEQVNFLNCCDIGLVTLSEGMYGLGVPSKVYNIMACGKPILYIGDKFSEIDLYIKDNNIGWSFDWNYEDDILNYLNNLNEKIDIRFIGNNSKNFAFKHFRENIALDKYKKLLN